MSTINKDIADTILAQLGGGRFTAMTGAKNYSYGNRYLQFQLPRLCNGVNYVKVALEINDTYTVTFGKYSARTLEFKIIDSREMVYADNLRAIFTERTGLATSL
jgi:hypothetical protein